LQDFTNEHSSQSQLAPLKLRSLALVASSGALTRPCELHLWQLHCENLPSAPGRSSQILAAVPRPGCAGLDAGGGIKKERRAGSSGSERKRSTYGWFIPTNPPGEITPGSSLPSHHWNSPSLLTMLK